MKEFCHVRDLGKNVKGKYGVMKKGHMKYWHYQFIQPPSSLYLFNRSFSKPKNPSRNKKIEFDWLTARGQKKAATLAGIIGGEGVSGEEGGRAPRGQCDVSYDRSRTPPACPSRQVISGWAKVQCLGSSFLVLVTAKVKHGGEGELSEPSLVK